jgi:hypothetical protein
MPPQTIEVECENHENEGIRILFRSRSMNGICPLCEARMENLRLQAQYEKAKKAAMDLASLVLKKDAAPQAGH